MNKNFSKFKKKMSKSKGKGEKKNASPVTGGSSGSNSADKALKQMTGGGY